LASERLALQGELQTRLPECDEASSQNPYWADCTTYIGMLHNRSHFCAPQLFLRESEERENEQQDHNRVLLRKMFTTSEFADECDESVGAIRPVQDRYMNEFDQIRAQL
jgi:hypothetical protein